MSTVLQLVQGTTEWHEHRRRYRNASETAAVMGVSPWMTPYQLWELRTGRREQEVTYAMRRGQELEPKARAMYEAVTGRVMEPQVLVDGEYSASLDGLDLSGELILEVKCPLKGASSSTWREVEAGKLPEHYHWQVQHQLMVAKAERTHFLVFDGQAGFWLEVQPNLKDQRKLKTAWDEFMAFVSSDKPPPLSERDTVLRQDDDWRLAAEAYRSLKAEADEKAAQLDEAKAKLVGLMKHSKVAGFGVYLHKDTRGRIKLAIKNEVQ